MTQMQSKAGQRTGRAAKSQKSAVPYLQIAAFPDGPTRNIPLLHRINGLRRDVKQGKLL